MQSELIKQHLSTRIYLGYILFIEKYHPEIDLDALCKDCGLSLQHIRDQNNWVSVVFDLRFMERVHGILKKDNIEYEVGEFSVSRECIGPLYVLGNVLSLAGLYNQVVSYGPRLNRVVKFEILKHERRHFQLRVSPTYEGLNPQECEALDKIFPAIVSSMKGYYTAFPSIKGLENADVKLAVGNNAVKFDVNYPLDRMTLSQNSIVLVAGILLMAVGLFAGQTLIVTWSVTVSVLFAFTSFFGIKRNKGLEDLAEENQRQNRDLNDSNRKLQDANITLSKANEDLIDSNAKLKRQLAISTTTGKIASHLGENSSKEQLLNAIAKHFAEGLGYDRVIILLKNKTTQLEFAAGFLDNSRFAEVIKSQKFETNLPTDDPSKIGNIFRNRASVLIDDVRGHMSKLSLEGRQLFELSESKSFLAVPIFNEDESVGVLMADNAFSDRRLSVEDLKNAETCAFQVGSVLKRLEAEFEAQASQAHVEKLARAASRFVPDDMIALLGCKSVVDVELSMAQQHSLAIMFTDIRGFTSLSETMTPTETASFLLSYYRNHGPSISQFGGMIDKLLGDGILALFKDANQAMASAIDFQIQLARYNRKNRSGGDRRPIKTGVGLHFDDVRVASIGFENHLSVTVVASGVNYASRLDELNKKFGTDILCSAKFFDLVRDKDAIRYVGSVQARGQSAIGDIYEIIGHKTESEIKLLKLVEPFVAQASRSLQNHELDVAEDAVRNGLAMSPFDSVLLAYRAEILSTANRVRKAS